MKTKHLPLTIIFGLMLVACSTVTPTMTETPAASPSPASPTQAPTDTSTSPPATATLGPTATNTNTPTARPPTPTTRPAYPPEGYGPVGFPAEINPLTGLSVTDLAVLERRPLATKIDIVPRNRNRPPWGLASADIVYDFYHNDGYTRFHAIFYGTDAELIGSIRSARLLDDPLVQMYKSLFVYGGADQRIDRRLINSAYSAQLVREGRNNLCPPTPENPLCRYDPNGYNILLAGTKEVHAMVQAKGVDDSRQNLDGMFFQQAVPPEGAAASQITARFSNDDYTRWDYEAETESYSRSQDAAQDMGAGERFDLLLDRLTEKQVTAANVVVLLVQHNFFAPPPGEIIEILLNGSGNAYAFRDGRVYQVKWNRPTAASVLFLTYPDGKPFPFKPGNTWFEVVGTSSNISEPSAAAWRFDFRIP
jgi:hypothetical protein